MLRHDFQIIDDATIIDTLIPRSDEFIALEAIPTSQISARSNATGVSRRPLKPITNGVNGQDGSKIAEHHGGMHKTASPKPVTPRGASITAPASKLPHSALQLGWFDFACDRREELQRSAKAAPRYDHNPDEIRVIDETIKAQEVAFNDMDKKFYVDRATRIRAVTPSFGAEYRGFWSYLYDNVFSRYQVTTPRLIFKQILREWTQAPAIHATFGARNSWFLNR